MIRGVNQTKKQDKLSRQVAENQGDLLEGCYLQKHAYMMFPFESIMFLSKRWERISAFLSDSFSLSCSSSIFPLRNRISPFRLSTMSSWAFSFTLLCCSSSDLLTFTLLFNNRLLRPLETNECY